jgi:hypothetical protein
MKLQVALEILQKEVGKIQGASPAFFVALGYLLGALEAKDKHELPEGLEEFSGKFETITLEEK